jgi:hypothetical protein
MPKKKNDKDNRPTVDNFMAQCITPWNGALYTRKHLRDIMRQHGYSRQCIDWFSCWPNALSEQEIADMAERGDLINSVPNVFPAWYTEFEQEILNNKEEEIICKECVT